MPNRPCKKDQSESIHYQDSFLDQIRALKIIRNTPKAERYKLFVPIISETRKDIKRVISKTDNGQVVLVELPGVPHCNYDPNDPFYFNGEPIHTALEQDLDQKIDRVRLDWPNIELGVRIPNSEKVIRIPQDSLFSIILYYAAILESESEYVKSVSKEIVQKLGDLAEKYQKIIFLRHSGGNLLVKGVKTTDQRLNGREDDFISIGLAVPDQIVYGSKFFSKLLGLVLADQDLSDHAKLTINYIWDILTGTEVSGNPSNNINEKRCHIVLAPEHLTGFNLKTLQEILSDPRKLREIIPGLTHSDIMKDHRVVKLVKEFVKKHIGKIRDDNADSEIAIAL